MADEICKKILHIDDEPDITYVVEFVLSSNGFEVGILSDSTQAVSELLNNKYCLLILDLMMPKIDGFEVIKRIREEETLKQLPILILSSRQLSTEETNFLKQMNAQVISKPFEPHRLLEKVREIVAE
ncbi:MAG: response regulator [Pseudomonadota bacterium]